MQWHLDQEAAARLHSLTGHHNAEDATPVTLFVGAARDDDGKPVYGLHAYESEYPEEGCTPLAEFDPPRYAPITEEMAERCRALQGWLQTCASTQRDDAGATAIYAAFAKAMEDLLRPIVAGVNVLPSEPVAWLRSDGMKAMPADEKAAWIEAGQPEIADDYTIPLYAADGMAGA